MSRLFKKTLAVIIGLFVLISLCISLVSGWQVYQGMNHEFQTKGSSIAGIIADASIGPILDDSPATLQSMIDEYLNIVGCKIRAFRDWKFQLESSVNLGKGFTTRKTRRKHLSTGNGTTRFDPIQIDVCGQFQSPKHGKGFARG